MTMNDRNSRALRLDTSNSLNFNLSGVTPINGPQGSNMGGGGAFLGLANSFQVTPKTMHTPTSPNPGMGGHGG